MKIVTASRCARKRSPGWPGCRAVLAAARRYRHSGLHWAGAPAAWPRHWRALSAHCKDGGKSDGSPLSLQSPKAPIIGHGLVPCSSSTVKRGQLRSSYALPTAVRGTVCEAQVSALLYMRDFRDHTTVMISTEAAAIRPTPTIIASAKCFLTTAIARARTKSTIAADCHRRECRFTGYIHLLAERPQPLRCHRFLISRPGSLVLDRRRRLFCLPSKHQTPRWPSTLPTR